MYQSPTVALSFFYYIIRFVGVSAVTLLVCLINGPDLHVVSIAKLYVIKNLNLSDYEKREIMYYANTKDPDQSAHLHTLIRILTFNRYILQ